MVAMVVVVVEREGEIVIDKPTGKDRAEEIEIEALCRRNNSAAKEGEDHDDDFNWR